MATEPGRVATPLQEHGSRDTLTGIEASGRQAMAGSPYATLAGVLQADVTTLREAFFYHTSRHQCREGECKAREVLSLARDKISEMLERETASSSPAPQRSVTFTPRQPS